MGGALLAALAESYGALSLGLPAAATLWGAALLGAAAAGYAWPLRLAAAYHRGVAGLLGALALGGLLLTAADAAGAVALEGRWGGTAGLLGAERFGFHLSLSPLSLYFLTLSFGMVALALANFGSGALEERAAEGPAAPHRRWALLTFGVLMASLALCLGLFFGSENVFLVFSAFEASALPIFLVVSFFGKRSQKFRASAYLLYFTLAGGLPLLTVLLTLYAATGSLLRPELAALLAEQRVAAVAGWEGFFFLACFLPFGVKLAFFPLHSWLPEAHVEASTEGSMLLSGILLKLGFYGLLQYCLGLWGGALFGVGAPLLTLALVGATATALATYRQLDLKKVIAYSSVVHMNLALFGYLTLAPSALAAALFLNFGHAVVSAGLFGAVGLLQDRSRSRSLLELSGLAAVLPLWSGALLLLLLANAGLPGTVGFVGEAPLLWGCFRAYPYAGLLLTLPTALMGLRCFLLHSQLCWGVAPAFLNPRPLAGGGALLRSWDVSPGGEGAVTLALAAASLLLGLWPSPLLGLLAPAAVGPLAALAVLAVLVGLVGLALGFRSAEPSGSVAEGSAEPSGSVTKGSAEPPARWPKDPKRSERDFRGPPRTGGLRGLEAECLSAGRGNAGSFAMKYAAHRRLQREVRKRSAVVAGEKRRLLLGFLLRSSASAANRLRLAWGLLRQQGKARRSHCRRHCLLTGRGRSVYRHFRLTRNAVRLLAHRGHIYGLRKASWLLRDPQRIRGLGPAFGRAAPPPALGPRRPKLRRTFGARWPQGRRGGGHLRSTGRRRWSQTAATEGVPGLPSRRRR